MVSVRLLFTSVSCAKTAEPFRRGLVEGDQRTIGGDPDHPMEWVLLNFFRIDQTRYIVYCPHSRLAARQPDDVKSVLGGPLKRRLAELICIADMELSHIL